MSTYLVNHVSLKAGAELPQYLRQYRPTLSSILHRIQAGAGFQFLLSGIFHAALFILGDLERCIRVQNTGNAKLSCLCKGLFQYLFHKALSLKFL